MQLLYRLLAHQFPDTISLRPRVSQPFPNLLQTFYVLPPVILELVKGSERLFQSVPLHIRPREVCVFEDGLLVGGQEQLVGNWSQIRCPGEATVDIMVVAFFVFSEYPTIFVPDTSAVVAGGYLTVCWYLQAVE